MLDKLKPLCVFGRLNAESYFYVCQWMKLRNPPPNTFVIFFCSIRLDIHVDNFVKLSLR